MRCSLNFINLFPGNRWGTPGRSLRQTFVDAPRSLSIYKIVEMAILGNQGKKTSHQFWVYRPGFFHGSKKQGPDLRFFFEDKMFKNSVSKP